MWISALGNRRAATFWRLLVACALAVPASASADLLLPAEVMGRLAQPWPPSGWTVVLDMQDTGRTQPYRSEPILRPGYFGQTLYRHIAGTDQYWTANVLIQDRGGPGAAWRAVSAVRCKSRVYRGLRARECARGGDGRITKTLHYEIDRFYVTIQVSGPGATDYPKFDIGSVTSPYSF
jgi:hypothetical protein